MITTLINLVVMLAFLIKCSIKKDEKARILLFIHSFFVFNALANTVLPNLGLTEDSLLVHKNILIVSFYEIFIFMFLMGSQKKHRRELILSEVNGQEEERNRLDKDLHDSLGANISILKMKRREADEETKKTLQDTITKIREVSRGLVVLL